jgi:NTP pyrophosphatase (non-canonical NTP hydrolase)
MKISTYQRRAQKTDRTGDEQHRAILIAVLGMAGEAGTLATTLKKYLRDGAAYKLYGAHVAEELGDVLWYVSTIATKFGLSLERIAGDNLRKVSLRWPSDTALSGAPAACYDATFPVRQRLPRRFTIDFREKYDKRRILRVSITRNGGVIGDRLGDNAHVEDGYRYHDVFHLANAAVLGWSPVTRKLLGCKRRADAQTDEVEDGGRATVIEEAIAAFVFDYAKGHHLLEGVDTLDFDMLKAISRLADGLEVKAASWHDWELAILEGYKMFRILNRNRGGRVLVDLAKRQLNYISQSTRHGATHRSGR